MGRCSATLWAYLLLRRTLRLRKPLANGKWQRAAVVLEPRSAYFLEGPVRWEWEHSIPPVNALRNSITFRNLPQNAGEAPIAPSISRP